MTDDEAGLVCYGPGASHSVGCCVRGCEGKAILNLAAGVYGPCWRCELEWFPPTRRGFWWRFHKRARRKLLPKAQVVTDWISLHKSGRGVG